MVYIIKCLSVDPLHLNLLWYCYSYPWQTLQLNMTQFSCQTKNPHQVSQKSDTNLGIGVLWTRPFAKPRYAYNHGVEVKDLFSPLWTTLTQTHRLMVHDQVTPYSYLIINTFWVPDVVEVVFFFLWLLCHSFDIWLLFISFTCF